MFCMSIQKPSSKVHKMRTELNVLLQNFLTTMTRKMVINLTFIRGKPFTKTGQLKRCFRSLKSLLVESDRKTKTVTLYNTDSTNSVHEQQNINNKRTKSGSENKHWCLLQCFYPIRTIILWIWNGLISDTIWTIHNEENEL